MGLFSCFLWWFIISVQKSKRFLYVNLVYCTLTVFVYSSSFCMKIFQFSIYSIVSSANNDSLLLPFWFLCILFLFLIWLLWLGLQNITINRSGERGILVFFLVLHLHVYSSTDYCSYSQLSVFNLCTSLFKWLVLSIYYIFTLWNFFLPIAPSC